METAGQESLVRGMSAREHTRKGDAARVVVRRLRSTVARPAQTFLDDRSAHLFRIALAAVVAVTLLVIAPAAKAGLSRPARRMCATPTSCTRSRRGTIRPTTSSSRRLVRGRSSRLEPQRRLGRERERVVLRQRPHRLALPLPAPGKLGDDTVDVLRSGDWNLRLFATSRSTSTSYLKVTVIVRSVIGELSIVDGGKISSSSNWQPSPKIHLLLTNLTGLLGTRAAFFRFTPVGPGGAWRIDDVYLDPFKST